MRFLTLIIWDNLKHALHNIYWFISFWLNSLIYCLIQTIHGLHCKQGLSGSLNLTSDALVLNYLGVSGDMDRKRDFLFSKFVFFLYKKSYHKRNYNIQAYCKGSNNFCLFDLSFKPTLSMFICFLVVTFYNVTFSQVSREKREPPYTR